MMSTHVIRPAEPQDVGGVLTLCAEHAAYERAAYSPDGKQAGLSALLFGDDARLMCFVVEMDDALCGYATVVRQHSTWLAASYLYLDCLYLRPNHRGRGLGKELMALVRAKAVELGCSEVQWQTPVFNTNAMRFYDRLATVRHHKVRYVWPAGPDSEHPFPVPQEIKP